MKIPECNYISPKIAEKSLINAESWKLQILIAFERVLKSKEFKDGFKSGNFTEKKTFDIYL